MKHDTTRISKNQKRQPASGKKDTPTGHPTLAPTPEMTEAQKKLAEAMKATEDFVAPAVAFHQIFEDVLNEIMYFQKAEYEATSRIEKTLRTANPHPHSDILIPFDETALEKLVGTLAWVRAVKQICMAMGLVEHTEHIVRHEIDKMYGKSIPDPGNVIPFRGKK